MEHVRQQQRYGERSFLAPKRVKRILTCEIPPYTDVGGQVQRPCHVLHKR